MKTTMGSAAFAAQYQQSPVPAGGNMINWEWFKWYDADKTPNFERVVISWDTAMKSSQLSDYSVGTVWGVFCDFIYLLDLERARLVYPALRRKVVEMYRQRPHAELVIEDTGSGTNLIQELREDNNIRAFPMQPEGDKIVRMAAQSAKIEGGVSTCHGMRRGSQICARRSWHSQMASTMTKWIPSPRP
jgi:predicted phage terminase large subunit-like protein